MKEYIITGDIGRKRDNFALMVIRDNAYVQDGIPALQSPDRIIHQYDIVHVEQAKGLRYEQMVNRFVTLAGHRDLSNNYDMLVDGTGVGDAVVEMLRQKGLYPIPIIFTSGDQVHNVSETMGNVFGNVPGQLRPMHTIKEIRVPKQDMIDAGVMLLQQGRIHLAVGLPLAAEVERQMNNFKGEVNKRTGKVKYEAEDEEIHDDITVCYLMGAWWLVRGRKDGNIEERPIPETIGGDSTTYEPAEFF